MLAISQSLFFVVFEVFVVHLSSLPSFKTPPRWQSLFDSHRQRRWFSLMGLANGRLLRIPTFACSMNVLPVVGLFRDLNLLIACSLIVMEEL